MNTEQLMKRCQIGCANLDDANNLLAECYGHIGMLDRQVKLAYRIGAINEIRNLVEMLKCTHDGPNKTDHEYAEWLEFHIQQLEQAKANA